MALVCAAIAVVASCSSGGAATATTTLAGNDTTSSTATVASTTTTLRGITAAPCGDTTAPPATYDHVIWIWMENHTAASVLNSPHAPFETMLAKECGTASNYSSVGAPSLPNYIGATSGGTQGITDDNPPAGHPVDMDNLFRQVRDSGRKALSYEEAMPAPCALDASGRYAVEHNPAAYYSSAADRAACRTDDVPLGTLTDGALAHAVDTDTLPAFAFVTPDLCDDTHDCDVPAGDAWLYVWVSRLVQSNTYRAGRTVIFVAWDEPTPMPFIAIAPSVPAGVSTDGAVNHYALLRTTEELLGVSSFLGAAATAPSMRAGFRL